MASVHADGLWYLRLGRVVRGPVSESQISWWIQSEGLTFVEVARDGSQEWTPARTTPPFDEVVVRTKRQSFRRWSLIIASLSTLTVVGTIGMAVQQKRDEARREVAKDQARADAKSAAAASAARAAASASAAKDAHDALVARFALMSRDERESRASGCSLGVCEPGEIEALIESTPSMDEKRSLRILAEARRNDGKLAGIASRCKDGGKPCSSQIGAAAGVISDGGLGLVKAMPHMSIESALQAPWKARGSAVRVSGTIVEMHCPRNGLCEGVLRADDSNVVRFYTPNPPGSITTGSSATFDGAFMQLYWYPNALGTTTNAGLLVGGFDN